MTTALTVLAALLLTLAVAGARVPARPGAARSDRDDLRALAPFAFAGLLCLYALAAATVFALDSASTDRGLALAGIATATPALLLVAFGLLALTRAAEAARSPWPAFALLGAGTGALTAWSVIILGAWPGALLALPALAALAVALELTRV